MILYQTIFNVDAQNKTIEDVKNICCDWLYSSRNSKFNPSNLKFNANEDTSTLSTNQTEKVLTRYVQYENIENFYFEYIKDLNKPDQWLSTIIVEKQDTHFTIGIKLKSISLNPRPNNKPVKKPLIIDKLIDNLGAAFDGELLIDEINYLDDSEYWTELVSKFMVGDFQGHLPCLYLSHPLTFNTTQIQDLQKELFGLAHIFIEPEEQTQSFSYLLRNKTEGKNAYHGSIGIYWKDGFSKKLFLKPNQTSHELLQELQELVRNSLLMQKFPQKLTLHFILEKKFRAQIDTLKQKTYKDPQDYEALIELYEQEIEAKNKKINELESSSYEAYAYQEFSKKVVTTNSNDVITIPYETKQYFENEAQYKLYNLLSGLSLKQSGFDDRNKEIFEQIQLNIKKDIDYQKYLSDLKELKNILSNYKGTTPKLRKILNIFNIELTEEGKHVKANFRLDTSYPQTFAKTPSDNRAGMNIYRDFKKILK